MLKSRHNKHLSNGINSQLPLPVVVQIMFDEELNLQRAHPCLTMVESSGTLAFRDTSPQLDSFSSFLFNKTAQCEV